MVRLRPAARISARIADEAHIAAVARVEEVEARRSGFGGQTASTQPKRRFASEHSDSR